MTTQVPADWRPAGSRAGQGVLHREAQTNDESNQTANHVRSRSIFFMTRKYPRLCRFPAGNSAAHHLARFRKGGQAAKATAQVITMTPVDSSQSGASVPALEIALR